MIQNEEATNESQKDVGAEELGVEDSIRRGYKWVSILGRYAEELGADDSMRRA